MMKPKLSLAALLSTATLTGAVWLASASPAGAFCPLSKFKGASESASGQPSSLVSQKLMFKKMAIAGAGIAAVGGLFALSMARKARRGKETEPVVAEVPQEEIEAPFAKCDREQHFAIDIPPEVLASTTSKEEASEQELTRIG